MTTTEPSLPDHPVVHRLKFSLFGKLMLGFTVIVVTGYGAWAFTGRELGTPERDDIPASVRSSPGGYRSYAFWHSGYHGGK